MLLPGLAKEREVLYPLRIQGKYQSVRSVVGNLLIAFLVVMPWVRIGGHQSLLFDLDARRFFVFGGTFTPRDTILLVVLVLGITFSLFFVTALFGRLWCGYACPQTVFLDSWIRPIEEWIEGPRAMRRLRDQRPLGFARIWRKALKWSLFALLSGGISVTVVSYLTPVWPLWSGEGPVWAYGLAAVLGFLGFWDLAWFREQFCSFLCPYARFQGALTDESSLVISYDLPRGDERANVKARRQAPEKDFGDCLDCDKCVAVCPYGVDIREGYQLECINCARCVDACTSVMAKQGKESLIRYSTEAQAQGQERRSWLRPRTVAYVGLLTTLSISLVVLMLGRSTLDASIGRAPGMLFTVEEDGGVRNIYMLQVTNQTEQTMEVSLSVEEDYFLTAPPITLEPTQARSVAVVLQARPEQIISETLPVHLHVSSGQEERILEATFKTPGNTAGAPE